MLKKLTIDRNKFGLILLTFFSSVLIFTALYSVFFQTPLQDQSLKRYKGLLAEEQIDLMTKFSLKNKLGSYEFEKKIDPLNPQANLNWAMTSPRFLPASEEGLNKVFQSLKNIRIRKTYSVGEVDASSFSLDNPVITMTLKENSGEEFSIFVGLTNPIDNSSYIQIPEQKSIYHIDSFDRSIEGLDIISLIEPRPFFPAMINAYKININILEGQKTTYNYIKKNNQWFSLKSETATYNEIEGIKNLAAKAFLDQLEQSKKMVEKSFASPLIEIEFLDNDNRMVSSFSVTSPINQNIPELKVDLKQFHLAKVKNIDVHNELNELYYVLSKESITELRFILSGQEARKIPKKEIKN